jgi:hypothetical protein
MFFFLSLICFSSTKLENRRVEQVLQRLGISTSERGKVVGKGIEGLI